MQNNKNNRAADITPTAEEKAAATTVPILLAIAKTTAIAQASQAAHDEGIETAARETAREIASSLTAVVDSPLKRNNMRLIDSLAKSLHIADMAAEHGITAPKVERYAADYNAVYLAGLFAAIAMAIFVAHEGREGSEFRLASLYADARTAISKAMENIPVTDEDAEAVTEAIDAIRKAVIAV